MRETTLTFFKVEGTESFHERRNASVLTDSVEAFRREEVSRGRLRGLSSVLGIKASDLLKLAEAA